MGTKRSAADEPGTGDPSAVTPAAFDTVRKGYRPEQVDTTVRELQWRLAMAEHAQYEAEERAASLTAALDAARASAPDTFGMRAEKVLRMAEHDADQRRERAVHDADQIIDAAHDEAERIVASARAEAEQARTEADASIAQVHAEAAAARQETDLCADAAAAMHEHVVGLRGAVRGELARLHAAMGAELRVLDELVLTPPPPAATATRDATTTRDAAATQDAAAVPEQRPQPSQKADRAPRNAAADTPIDARTDAQTAPAGA